MHFNFLKSDRSSCLDPNSSKNNHPVSDRLVHGLWTPGEEIIKETGKKNPSELLCAVLMNGEVGCAIIAQRVKIEFQPLLSSIRADWEFSSTCGNHLPCMVEGQLLLQTF